MNKMKKLLSVVLAVVIALSAFSMMGSAAITQYKTVAELEALDAYSPYGQVTRLSTEERASMIQDFLDNVLPGLGINMGEVFNVLGLSVTIDLTSVDRLCYSLDTVADTFSNFLFSIAKGIVNLGILEELKMDTWNTGIDRAGDSQLTLFAELFQLLSNNTGLVETVLTSGLDLGIIGGMIKGLDLSSINEMVTDLPSLVKGLVFPLIERWDDPVSLIRTYDTRSHGDGNVKNTANDRVKKLFSDNMSITTIKYDANGTMTSEHTVWEDTATGSAAPTASDSSLRYYYQISADGKTMYSYHIVDEAEAEALAKDNDENNNVAAYNYIKENQVYRLEAEVEGSATYVWKAYKLAEDGVTVEKDADGKDVYLGTLKYYNDDSNWLDGISGDDIDLTTMSAGELLYKFIPPVFKNMAPVVLNGSVKKILAEFFGAKFAYVGLVGDEAVNALPDASDTFFTEEQGEYLWEWSNYAVINGNHYYRFEDQIFKSDLSAVNNYFDIIDWNYEITGDFMNEFVPASDDSTDTRLLQNVNNFLIKVAEEVLLPSAETDNMLYELNATWTRPTFTKGDNSNLVNNIKALAQAIISLAPAHIFGSDYAENERCYYDLMMSTDNDTILTGIAAHLVNMIMPSMSLPGKSQILASKAKVGAILAAVIREFAAYLAPEYNFDALIYADFGTTTADPNKTFVDPEAAGLITTGQTASGYWFDVCLTMGINIGFEYLRAFSDMGENSTEWNSFVSYSGYGVDGKTYAANTTQAALNAEWEGMLDYVIDWALDKDYEWTWKMENLVDVSSFEVNLATAQDPFVKLQAILGSILPVDQILTVTPASGQEKIEHWLRDDLILGIVDLNWGHLIDTLQFSGANFRTTNVLDGLANLLKPIINSLFKKIGGGSYELIPSAVTTFDNLASQANIRTLAVNLVGKLETAYNNGLLDTLAPFLNFLLGWKTDPQVVADPQIWTSFRDGNDYAFQWTGNGVYPAMDADNTKILFLNNSSGMLETHRNSNVTDHAYDITIKSVTSDATTNTLTFDYGDGVCSPWETLEIKVNGTYVGEESVTVTIAYDYVGKDGQAIGGTQYTSVTFLVSNQYEDANIEGRFSGDEKDGKYGIDPYKKYQFTEDIFTTVTTYEPSVWGTNETLGGTSNWKNTNAPDPVTRDCDGNITDDSSAIKMTGLAAQYFEYYQNRDGGWASSFPKDGSTSGKLYKAKAGVTAETFSVENSEANNLYGVYDMGQVAIKYSDDSKVWNIDFIYYNDYDIYDVYSANKNNGYNANQGVDAELYNRYNAAWKLIVYGATYPMMTSANNNTATDYVTTIQPYIPDALEEFEAAKEAYEKALAEAQASAAGDSSASLPQMIVALQEEIDDDFMNGKEINFQDYEFYEYFNYDDVKKAGEELYRTYLAPEVMDTYYILNSGIREAELNNVIANEANETKQIAIEASRLQNDQAAIDASITARNEWKQPVNTRLYVEDFTARIAYYKTFLNEANREGNEHLYFLNQEIAHVEAQQLVAGDYTAASWAKYADALADAKAVAAGADEFSSFNSRIYDVKYNLMVAYKELLKADDSLINAGGTADLLLTIEKAEEILAMNIDEIELSDKAIELGLTKEKALGHLIEGLGYYYVGEDGNTWNLYANSAYEYRDNDRPDKNSEQAEVDACNNNLVACIEYFKTEAAAPVLSGIDTGCVDEERGYVYGVVAGSDDLNLFFTVENGTFEMVANTAGYQNGTGATLKVLNEDNEVVATYTLIVFGDVNCDGQITAADKTAVDVCILGNSTASLTTEAAFAADVNGDGSVLAADKTLIDVCILSGTASTLTNNPYKTVA